MAKLEDKMAGLSTHPPKFAVRGRFVHANARRAGLIEFVDDGLIVVEDGAIVAVAKDADQIKAVLAEHRPQDVVELAEVARRPKPPSSPTLQRRPAAPSASSAATWRRRSASMWRLSTFSRRLWAWRCPRRGRRQRSSPVVEALRF